METNIRPFDLDACRWLEELLFERFGHKFLLRHEQRSAVVVECLDAPGGAILFDALQDDFWRAGGELPCCKWNPEAEGWTAAVPGMLPAPGASRLSAPLIERSATGFAIHYDILGMTYWMLTRQEEVGRTDLDEHGRFPATSSHSFQHGYLERPIVDEWLRILGQVIQRLWPQLPLKRHDFSMKVSHDVDRPSRYGFRSAGSLLRAVGGDVLRRGDFSGVVRGPWIRLNSRRHLHRADPYNTFDWLMDMSERHGLNSAFYFICGRTDPARDADYEPESAPIRDLMRRIHQRGHEIGLHPSYGTYRKPEAIAAEAERLKRICAEEGIKQDQWGGRMHYLRWETPATLQGWEQAAMSYDSSLSYADRPGFRCGTCFEYPAYDPVQKSRLSLRLRPLIAMEGTVMASAYLGLGCSEEAFAKFQQLKGACMAVDGCFTLLWHNSEICDDGRKGLYQRLLS